VLSSCSLPLPLACLLLTVNEARSSFASTIPCNVSVIFCCLTNRFLVSFISRHFNHTIKEPRPKSQSHEAKAITSWVQLPVINPNKVRFVMNKSACRVYVYGRIILKWTWQQRRVVSLKYTDVSEMRTTSIIKAIIKAVCISETSVYSNETTRSYIPEDFNLQKNKGLHIHRLSEMVQTQVRANRRKRCQGITTTTGL